MKRKIFLLSALLPLMLLFSLRLLSTVMGGDTLEVYVDGSKLIQQFIHMDKSVRTVTLPAVTAKSEVEVFYSHCGYAGTGRVLTIKDEKNNALKEYRFADVGKTRGGMSFPIRDVQRKGVTKLKLFYHSEEMKNSRLLAVLDMASDKLARK